MLDALIRAAFALALGLLAAAACPPTARANGLASDPTPRYDRFIVRFKPGSAPAKASAARQRALDTAGRGLGVALSHVRRLGVGADLVRVPSRLSFGQAQQVIDRLRRNPDVLYVELDQVVHPTLVANDPLYTAYQWHYFEPAGGINLPAAWDLASGAGTVVAFLDTGITRHSELDANVLPGYDFVDNWIVEGDNPLGRDADPLDPGDAVAADFCYPGSPPSTSSFHGTQVAGIIAALTNNDQGVAGVAFNARLLPVRVLARCGGTSADIADGIVWAAGGQVPGVPLNPNPAEVINLSLGGPGFCGVATQAAIDFATEAGAVVVVAAGNDALDARGFQPANCANVVTVGSTGRTGAASSFSNFGPALDLSAPGGDEDNGIATTWNDGMFLPDSEDYALSAGTSLSAPHVSGAIALMQSMMASSPTVVEAVLKNSARALPVACPQGCGSGILDARAALDQVQAGALVVSDASVNEGDAGTRLLEFTVSLSRPMVSPVTFDIATGNGTATAGSDYVALNLVGQTIAPGSTRKTFSIIVNGDAAVEGTETFTLTVSNLSGIAAARSQAQGLIRNDDATMLANGVGAGPVTLAVGEWAYYSLQVPVGAPTASFSLAGGSGDGELFVRYGALPSPVFNDYASETIGNEETIQVQGPAPGTWYLLVAPSTTMSGATVKGEYAAPPTPTLSVGDVAVIEGNAGTSLATFTVSLTPVSASPVSFDMYTEAGTAIAGVDFQPKAQTGMVIAAGQSSASFSVTINGDTAVEANETFAAELRNASGAAVAKPRGQGRIHNDDLASLSVGDVSITEGSSGQSTVTFTVRLDRPMPSPVSYDIATANGTAASGSDYVARNLPGRFIDAGRVAQVFEVQVIGDATPEANESLQVVVGNVSGAVLADGIATGTILNDDGSSLAARATARRIPVAPAAPSPVPTPQDCRLAPSRAKLRGTPVATACADAGRR